MYKKDKEWMLSFDKLNNYFSMPSKFHTPLNGRFLCIRKNAWEKKFLLSIQSHIWCSIYMPSSTRKCFLIMNMQLIIIAQELNKLQKNETSMTNYMKMLLCIWYLSSQPIQCWSLDKYINRTRSSLIFTLVDLLHMCILEIKYAWCVLQSTTWENK
jgi:hypothetical protein